MKGLFIKDIALMKHNKRLLMIIFLTVLFLLMSGMNSSFLMGYMKTDFPFCLHCRFPEKSM